MSGHKHADKMALYAHDALKNDKPWELWRYKTRSMSEFGSCYKHPEWNCYIEYERIPQVIMINGIEVPKPEFIAPVSGTKYFVPAISSDGMYYSNTWSGCRVDEIRMNKGVVHLTKESAIAHAKALLSFTDVGK